ncbi:MAG: hypothetical protein R3346_03925 [Candidatus Spechtbacterales bacterium]|nr:hypothetical protein [Candidatus Spechtbacterales bacterium]
MDLPTWVWVLIVLTWLPVGAFSFRLGVIFGLWPSAKRKDKYVKFFIYCGYCSLLAILCLKVIMFCISLYKWAGSQLDNIAGLDDTEANR